MPSYVNDGVCQIMQETISTGWRHNEMAEADAEADAEMRGWGGGTCLREVLMRDLLVGADEGLLGELVGPVVREAARVQLRQRRSPPRGRLVACTTRRRLVSAPPRVSGYGSESRAMSALQQLISTKRWLVWPLETRHGLTLAVAAEP